MIGKVTLQDIAKLTGVAPATVYKALSNSKGVSEKKRAEIVQVAKNLNYSSLSTNAPTTQTIAVLFPAPEGEDQYFYQYIWAGIAAREEELRDSSLRVIKVTFDGTIENQLERMELILKLYANKIQGLITIVWEESRFLDIIDRFHNSGIPVFTISSDAPSSARTMSIMANSYKTGRLAAEYMGSVIKDFGRVLIIGTKRDAYNHSNMVRGFFDQMNISNPKIQVIEVYESKKYPEKLQETVQDFLSAFDYVQGIYTNNARTTALIIKTLQNTDKAKSIVFVGSEAFRESIIAMKDGTINALIDQDAFRQGYEGLSLAYKVISGNKEVDKSTHYISSRLYLQSNVPSLKDEEEMLNREIKLNQELELEIKLSNLNTD